ncbi:MAG: hypothetical protein KIT45_09725 [Fimbriimonadia bacterium]|nr:hypothetical protein [Fimbriimonadia bacterium]
MRLRNRLAITVMLFLGGLIWLSLQVINTVFEGVDHSDIRALSPRKSAPRWKVVRVSNVLDFFYPESAEVFIDRKSGTFRFVWDYDGKSMSVQIRNVVIEPGSSFEETVTFTRKGRTSEGYVLTKQSTLETHQGIEGTMLVFTNPKQRKVQEWVLLKNPGVPEHVAVIYWSCDKDDYPHFKNDMRHVIRQTRLLPGPAEWSDDPDLKNVSTLSTEEERG